MISNIQLKELEAVFRNRLPDDTGMAQLALLLLLEVRRSRSVLEAAATPVEHMLDEAIDGEVLKKVSDLAGVIEEALETHKSDNAVADPYADFDHCDIDEHAFDAEYKEYFDCEMQGSQRVFKFTLNPKTGAFGLHTHLDCKRNFWKRLWAAFRYTMGERNGGHGHWDTIMLDRSSTERLHRLTNEALDAKRAVVA